MRHAGALSVFIALFLAEPVFAHDIDVPRESLKRDVKRLTRTLKYLKAHPAGPDRVETEDEQRRRLGAAEIEVALGHTDRALEILMGRLADPRFQRMPEYIETLLLTAELLAQRAENAGAMMYAELALQQGGTPGQMAEAAAQWFRGARQSRRVSRQIEIYELWRRQGGEAARGDERAAMARYEVAFALRAEHRYADALALLREVPSESAFGSRAAYLAGVAFVEYGDLTNAERWFSAIMDWALPALPDAHPQLGIERRVRALAALSAGRLRFERGDLESAAAAYQRVPPASPYGPEACWERAYLDLERDVMRGALKRFQCVVDLGAEGQRGLEARLFKASLLAHLRRYEESIQSYEALHVALQAEHAVFARAADTIDPPADFLFKAMERNVSRRTPAAGASPGPSTLFADAWTDDVDRAYRIDRGAQFSRETLNEVLVDLERIEAAVTGRRAFVGYRVRRQHLEILLREVRHLEGHAGATATRTGQGHDARSDDHSHIEDLRALQTTIDRLRALGREVEAAIDALNKDQNQRREAALAQLGALRREIQGIRRALRAVEEDATVPMNAAAHQAIAQVREALREAAMKAEFGVLDTFWLKKQHRTRAVENLLHQQKETERQLEEALDTAP